MMRDAFCLLWNVCDMARWRKAQMPDATETVKFKEINSTTHNILMAEHGTFRTWSLQWLTMDAAAIACESRCTWHMAMCLGTATPLHFAARETKKESQTTVNKPRLGVTDTTEPLIRIMQVTPVGFAPISRTEHSTQPVLQLGMVTRKTNCFSTHSHGKEPLRLPRSCTDMFENSRGTRLMCGLMHGCGVNCHRPLGFLCLKRIARWSSWQARPVSRKIPELACKSIPSSNRHPCTCDTKWPSEAIGNVPICIHLGSLYYFLGGFDSCAGWSHMELENGSPGDWSLDVNSFHRWKCKGLQRLNILYVSRHSLTVEVVVVFCCHNLGHDWAHIALKSTFQTVTNNTRYQETWHPHAPAVRLCRSGELQMLHDAFCSLESGLWWQNRALHLEMLRHQFFGNVSTSLLRSDSFSTTFHEILLHKRHVLIRLRRSLLLAKDAVAIAGELQYTWHTAMGLDTATTLHFTAQEPEKESQTKSSQPRWDQLGITETTIGVQSAWPVVGERRCYTSTIFAKVKWWLICKRSFGIFRILMATSCYHHIARVTHESFLAKPNLNLAQTSVASVTTWSGRVKHTPLCNPAKPGKLFLA